MRSIDVVGPGDRTAARLDLMRGLMVTDCSTTGMVVPVMVH